MKRDVVRSSFTINFAKLKCCGRERDGSRSLDGNDDWCCQLVAHLVRDIVMEAGAVEEVDTVSYRD
jgi:hypothetical protein